MTDELFVSLCQAFNRVDLAGLPEVRHAVEAALADVPELSEEQLAGMAQSAAALFAQPYEARIAELKAKLAAVRELADEWERRARTLAMTRSVSHQAKGVQCGECAAELRERVKEGSCE